MVHRKGAATVPVSLPRKAKQVTELFSGTCVAEESDSFTAAFPDTDTRLYYLEFGQE